MALLLDAGKQLGRRHDFQVSYRPTVMHLLSHQSVCSTLGWIHLVAFHLDALASQCMESLCL